MSAFLFVTTIVLLIGLAVFLAQKQGKAAMRADKEEEINNAVLKAVLVRDRLERDPDYARRLRQTFTRKLLPDLPAGLHKPERLKTNVKTDRRE